VVSTRDRFFNKESSDHVKRVRLLRPYHRGHVLHSPRASGSSSELACVNGLSLPDSPTDARQLDLALERRKTLGPPSAAEWMTGTPAHAPAVALPRTPEHPGLLTVP
jgi:hypothetical protein